MARRPLFRGGELEGVPVCDQCHRQVLFGFMLSVEIDGVKRRVCSFECRDKLKEAKANVGISTGQ